MELVGGDDFPTRKNQIWKCSIRNLTKNTMDGSNRNTQLLVIFGKVRNGTYASSSLPHQYK
jgi:hypothetical protein